MQIRMKTPLRKMPDEVLASIFKIMQHHEEDAQDHDFDELPAAIRRRITKHVQIIATWLNAEGLRVSDLVAVLAVPKAKKGPTFVFAFGKTIETSADSSTRKESTRTAKTKQKRRADASKTN